MNNANIIVELDALQDTALGVIAAHNAVLGVKAVMDEEFWHSRVVEGMGSLLPPDVFDTLYAGRASNAMEVLRNSPLTGVPLMIAKFVASHAANADARFYDSKMAIHINIWPYDMTPEVRDIYRRTAYKWFDIGPITDLQIVRFSPSELTPKYLNGMYTQMYIRDIRPWFKAQAEALAKYQIPLFTMVAPRIVRNVDKTLFDSIPSDKKGLDLFEETTRWHSGIIGLDFIDNRFFSYIPVPTEADLATAKEIIGQEEESGNV